MNANHSAEISPEAIKNLAFMNWEKDGCPKGRDMDYWLEAESQLKATWHLFQEDNAISTTRKPETYQAKRGTPARTPITQKSKKSARRI